MSASYYRKIYNRFGRQSNDPIDIKNDKPNSDYSQPNSDYGQPNSDYSQPKSDYSKLSSENSSERTVRNLNFCMQPPPRRAINTKEINIVTNKKRDIKDKLKEHQDIIDNFILSKTNLIDRSIGIYRHVLEDFVKFSLSIDPNAVPRYIRWRFKLDSNLTDEEITLEGTALKYESVLAQFFNYIGNKIQRNFNRNTILKCQFDILLFYFKANINLIWNTYMELTWKSQYQDALIIHLMYSLSLDPYHIYSLRYEDILSKNLIQYWDYKSSVNKICYLYYELWSDIYVIKDIKKPTIAFDTKLYEQWLIKQKLKENLSSISLPQTSTIDFIENLETVLKTLTLLQMILSNFQNLMHKK